jgi:succinoglycan biosynthesis transport protein ExoP
MSSTDSGERRTPAAARQEGLAADLEILSRHWRMVVLVVLVSVAAFGFMHERQAKSYTATSSVTFQSDTLLDSALNIATATSSEPQREADTEVLIAHSAEVAEAVREQLKATSATNELLSEVKVEAAPTADVLNIVATTHDPQASATLANAFAAQYIAFHTKSQLSGIAANEAGIREEIKGLPAASPERATLETTLIRLNSLQGIAGGGTNVIAKASPPSSPNGGGISQAIVIGLLVGLAIGFALVFLRESLDRRIKTVADFERGYRLPALSGIPRTSARVLRTDSSALLEPYRILRSALGFTAVTRQLNTLLVTSAVAGEGKSTVAVNLARVIALSGRRTVLVELDLRRPTTLGAIELGGERGVTTLFTGGAELSELLRQPLADLPNLLVLPSGALPHNPSELLSSRRVNELLAELTADGSMVIVDSAPLNPVADAQVLLDNPAIDAAVIVARIDRTTREEMRHARSILDHHEVEPVGLVVTGVRDPRRYGYGYGTYQSPQTIEGEPKQPAPAARERPAQQQPAGGRGGAIVKDEDEHIETLAGRPANGSTAKPVSR